MKNLAKNFAHAVFLATVFFFANFAVGSSNLYFVSLSATAVRARAKLWLSVFAFPSYSFVNLDVHYIMPSPVRKFLSTVMQ